MVPEVTLIPKVSMNIITLNFKSLSLKMTKSEGGGCRYFNPPLRRISWQWGLRGIGLIVIIKQIYLLIYYSKYETHFKQVPSIFMIINKNTIV